jgi:hypothetical protein
MIRQLADCPYCGGCEIALTDNPDVAINPDKAGGPCPHLVWVAGRYSQYQLSPIAGRRTKVARMIGSTEFEWVHPDLTADDADPRLSAHLRQWTAGDQLPAAAHRVQAISRDQAVTEADGRSYPSWEIEGIAVFAEDAATFLNGLEASLDRPGAGPFDFSAS